MLPIFEKTHLPFQKYVFPQKIILLFLDDCYECLWEI